MSSERAGVHTSGDAVLDAIRECAAPGMELRYDGSEDPVAAAYVAGVQTAYSAAKDALGASEQDGALGALDREKAFEVLQQYGAVAYPATALLDALEACVVPDPRIARIEALIEEPWVGSTPDGRAVRMGMRAILRGDQ